MHFSPSQHQTGAIDTHIVEASVHVSMLLHGLKPLIRNVPKRKRYYLNLTKTEHSVL